MTTERTTSRIAENYDRFLQEVAAACARSGRAVSDVKLVAVTKYAKLAWVRALVSLGVVDLGESRPQQLCERAEQLGADQPVRWHLIGHLQRNKVRRVLPTVTLIHSVDSVRLLERINATSQELELRPRVLLEVNVAGETAKHGFSAEALGAAWEQILDYKSVQVEGLMTMAPKVDRPDEARSVFCQLRELRDELAERSPEDVRLSELSMGMSGDFAAAVEEGATLVRIGSRLFEELSDGGDGL
jgi:hypothetical protein